MAEVVAVEREEEEVAGRVEADAAVARAEGEVEAARGAAEEVEKVVEPEEGLPSPAGGAGTLGWESQAAAAGETA